MHPREVAPRVNHWGRKNPCTWTWKILRLEELQTPSWGREGPSRTSEHMSCLNCSKASLTCYEAQRESHWEPSRWRSPHPCLKKKAFPRGWVLLLKSQKEKSQRVDVQKPSKGLSRSMTRENLAINRGQSPRGDQFTASGETQRVLFFLAKNRLNLV